MWIKHVFFPGRVWLVLKSRLYCIKFCTRNILKSQIQIDLKIRKTIWPYYFKNEIMLHSTSCKIKFISLLINRVSFISKCMYDLFFKHKSFDYLHTILYSKTSFSVIVSAFCDRYLSLVLLRRGNISRIVLYILNRFVAWCLFLILRWNEASQRSRINGMITVERNNSSVTASAATKCCVRGARRTWHR